MIIASCIQMSIQDIHFEPHSVKSNEDEYYRDITYIYVLHAGAGVICMLIT